MKTTSIGRKILSWCLLISVLCTLLGGMTFSVSAETEGDFTYEIADGACTITKYTGSSSAVTVPSTLGGLPVTAIGDGVFYGHTEMTSVSIPDSVTTIGNVALNSTGLTEVVIPNSVVKMGEYVLCSNPNLTKITLSNQLTELGRGWFSYCTALTEFTVPDTIQKIVYWAFDNCHSLKKVTLPDTLQAIDSWAFYACTSLETISIPASVTSIGSCTFQNCSSLTDISVVEENAVYMDKEGVLFTKDEKRLVRYPAGLEGAYTVPEGTEVLGDYSFAGSQKFTGVTLPESLTSVEHHAFSECNKLTTLHLPKQVSSWGELVTYDCNTFLTFTVDGENSTFMAEDGVLFTKDQTKLVCCPSGRQGAYTVPDGVQIIGENAFCWCDQLTSITLPDSVTVVEDQAFRWCYGVTEFVLSNQLVSIGDQAFYWCKAFQELALPESVTTVGNEAFINCKKLSAIVVLPTVTHIGTGAFTGCDVVTMYGIRPSYPETYALENNIPFMELELPKPTSGSCGENLTWSLDEEYTLIITGEGPMFDYEPGTAPWAELNVVKVIVESGVTSIGTHAFENLTGLTGATVAQSVTAIGEDAFKGCPDLTIYGISGSEAEIHANANEIPFVSLGGEVDEDGNRTGKCGDNLTWIWTEEGVLTVTGEGEMYDYGIGTAPWWGLSISKVVIEEGATSVGNRAFSGCTDLTELTLADSITSIGKGAFSYCYRLSELGLPQSLTAIGDHAFYDCGGLLEVTIPEGTVSIGDRAFGGCVSLASVTLPQRVVSMGAYTFADCTSLTLSVASGSYSEGYAKHFEIPFQVASEASDWLLGDVNHDKAINAADALLVLQHTVKLTDLTGEAGDVTFDNRMDAADALRILQFTVKLIDQFA